MFDWGRTLYDRYAARKTKLLQPMSWPPISICKFWQKPSKDSIESTNCGMSQRQNVPVFDAIEKNQFQIKTEIKRRVHFKQHDLLKDPYNGPFDVIVCRNVTIYFKSDARDAVYQKFSDALVPGAFCLRERQKRSISRNNSVSRKSIRLSIKSIIL